MRDFIDSILTFIGTSSLTDNEFDSLTIQAAAYDVETYNAIWAILDSRESISTLGDRLTYYFQAKGLEITTPSSAKSNILVGGVLE